MRHNPAGLIDPFEIPDIADGVLNDAFRVTGELKVKTFLVFGTCLGFIRDGGHIEDDPDIDIGVICPKDKKEMLFEAFLANGFTRNKMRFLRYHNNVHFYKNKILLDIYFCREGEFYSRLESTWHKGIKYPIPYPVDKYLSTCYSNCKVKEKQLTQYYGG